MHLLETHVHTDVSSSCGLVSPEKIPWLYKKAGYDALVVTDHYYEKTITSFSRSADAWLQGYRRVKEAGREAGIKVFLGMELRLNNMGFDDFLVYGFDEGFINKYERLYKLPLSQAFKLLDSYGFLIYQAHPFRPGISVANPLFIHGVEVFNGKQRQDNNNEKAEAFAVKHSLLQISGSDFHRHEDIGSGGIYIDEGIETEKELACYLKTHQVKLVKD